MYSDTILTDNFTESIYNIVKPYNGYIKEMEHATAILRHARVKEMIAASRFRDMLDITRYAIRKAGL